MLESFIVDGRKHYFKGEEYIGTDHLGDIFITPREGDLWMPRHNVFGWLFRGDGYDKDLAGKFAKCWLSIPYERPER